MRLPRTLSARMIIGFAILVGTFAGLSIATTANMNRLNQEIRVIRTGYLRLSLRTRDLAERQRAFLDFLRDELTGESTVGRVTTRIRRERSTRDDLLEDISDILEEQTGVPSNHARSFIHTSRDVAELRQLIAKTDDDYATLLKAVPIERIVDAVGDTESEELAAATGALKTLQRSEGRIRTKAQELARYQRQRVEQIAEGLVRGSTKLQWLSIVFGAAAIALGLIVIVWAVLTLRPLRRLPIAAQRIAEGDYAARIPERGPAEVAELASEFNSMAEALESRERELVRSERLATVGKMAAMITHEVRNPLSSIGLNTELLEEELGEMGDGATEAMTLCREITGEVDRLTEITETYLQFARLPQPRLQAEDLGALVMNVASFAGEEMKAKGIDMVVDVADNLPDAEIDHAQIKQGLLNLLRNSAEALEQSEGDEPRLSLVLRAEPLAEPSRLVLEVADNGPGIPADVLPNLFEPFFTTKKSGTGLGLALTQQIVREHNGTLDVDSKVGHGARFIVTLPLVSGPSVLAD